MIRRRFLVGLAVLGTAPAWARSSKARRDFQRDNPCPANGRTSGACPGYVVDHVEPIKRGGADHPSNMQWQDRDSAKAKDRWE